MLLNDIWKYIIDTYSTHHPETFIIAPIIFILYVYLLKQYTIPKRIFITLMIFCFAASIFGVLWWSIVPITNGIANVYFYSTLTILSLVMLYINNIKLKFFQPNKLLYILVPLLIIITYTRYVIPGNDYGYIWIINRTMELSFWLGFIDI